MFHDLHRPVGGKRHRRPTRSGLALGLGLLLGIGQVLAQSGPARRGPATAAPPGLTAQSMRAPPTVADYLPAPRANPGDAQQACRGSAAWSESSRAAQRGGYHVLGEWGVRYLGMQTYCRIDWSFLIAKWQETIGSPVTGTLSATDLERLRAEERRAQRQLDETLLGRATVRREQEQAREVAQAAALTTGTRTVAQFLPAPPGGEQASEQNCRLRVGQAQVALKSAAASGASEVVRAVGNSVAPAAVRERRLRLEALTADLSAKALHLPREWQDLWARTPELTEWADQARCLTQPRFMVEHWLVALGLPADVQAAAGITSTQEALERARTAHAEHIMEEDRKAVAAAIAAGRGRVLVVDDVSGRTKAADLSPNVPSDLCSGGATSIRCRIPPPACPAAAAELAKAGDEVARLRERYVAHPFNDQTSMTGSSPPELTQRFRLARDEARRCPLMPTSALMFAGQALQQLELDFDADGVASMRFATSSPEPVRNYLSRRIALPETQQEQRSRTDTAIVSGGTAWVGSTMVSVGPSVAQVPVSYSVTRSIWKSPAVRVEEAEGRFQFRFAR